MIYCFILLLYISWLPNIVNSATSSDESCTTRRNERGICVLVERCEPLYQLLINNGTDRRVVNYLRSLACGFENQRPKVCCTQVQKRNENKSITNACGHASLTTKIVGGNDSPLGAWPWMSAIGFRSNRDPGPKWYCGATLINNLYVVTAAHCLDVDQWEPFVVRVGDLNLNDEVSDGASPVDIPIANTIIHQAYSKEEVNNDIALIRLQRAVQFTDLIQPICLPSTPNIRTRSLVNEDVFVAGWGRLSFKGPRTDALQDLRIPIQDNNVCKRAYADKKGANVNNKVICAGVLTGGKDACMGDSGGPLMYLNNSTFYLVGIVSYGFRCAEVGHPGIYTRVSEYTDWISNNTR